MPPYWKSRPPRRRPRWLAGLAAALLTVAGLVALPAPASAAADHGPDRLGVVRTVGGHLEWHLRTSAGGGPAQYTFVFGRAGDVPVWGDWDNNGTKTPGVFRNGAWLLKNSLSGGDADRTVVFGRAGDTPVVGDWDGTGGIGIGVVRGRQWLLRQSVSGGGHQVSFAFGDPAKGDVPVVGDWYGTGADRPGVFRGGQWHLKRHLSGGEADLTFGFGRAGDTPVVGDWDGVGGDGPGVYRGHGQWLLRQAPSGGDAQLQYSFGTSGDLPVLTTRAPASPPNPIRSSIVSIANSQVGYQADPNQCNKYGWCADWCAMFARWVWLNAGVEPVFTTAVARAVGSWGIQQGTWKPRPSGSRGNPQPGDIVVYGPPGPYTGGHVAIVYSVNGNGTITTIDGNLSNRVVKRTIDPVTQRSGAGNWLISGYVSPPGAG